MTREHAPTRPVRHIAGNVAWALGTAWFAAVAFVDRVLSFASWRWKP